MSRGKVVKLRTERQRQFGNKSLDDGKTGLRWTGIADFLASGPDRHPTIGPTAIGSQGVAILVQHLTHHRCHSKCLSPGLWAKLWN